MKSIYSIMMLALVAFVTTGHKKFATQTDLSPKEVKAITEAVNPLIADAFALYVKTKNFHWHLYGSHFRDYHLLLDEHADAIFDSIDVMAERVQLEARPYEASVT